MDIRIESGALARELSLYGKIVDRKVTIPVLANVLMVADGDGVRLAATDQNLSLTGRCGASIDKPGSMTLPVLRLAEMAKALPNQEIRIWLDGHAARIKAGSYVSRLQALGAEDFPTMPTMPDVFATLPRATLRTMLSQTRHSITVSDKRYTLAGAQLTIDGDAITVVSTDAHRLTVATGKLLTPIAEKLSILIPVLALNEVLVLLAEPGEGPVGFAVSENSLFFAIDGRVLSSRRLDGKFPDYTRMVPRDVQHIASIDRSLLATAIGRVSLVAGDNPTISLALTPQKLRVAALSAEVGEAAELIGVAYDGPDLEVSVKATYVLEAIRESAVESVDLELKTVDDAMVWRGGPDYFAVVMPIRK